MFAEDFTASSEKWLPGVIQKVTGPLSYQIQRTVCGAAILL